MSIIFVLIPIAMLFVAIAVMVFFWAVKTNQYDDLDREAVNILFDEDQPKLKKENTTKQRQPTNKKIDTTNVTK
jgi:cbb3-type cytochrome oxidase maturation protein